MMSPARSGSAPAAKSSLRGRAWRLKRRISASDGPVPGGRSVSPAWNRVLCGGGGAHGLRGVVLEG
ncbi:MAG: hypothetical protein MZV70_40590 [Desulfobacterales bacterium]|nr:hypothetical protein [Desulfobacterales bacterium]